MRFEDLPARLTIILAFGLLAACGANTVDSTPAGPDAKLAGTAEIGSPCLDDVTCPGMCVNTDDGPVCAGACAGTGCASACLADCPEGFSCVPHPDVGGTAGVLCVPNDAVLCRPCVDDNHCAGLAQSLCMVYSNEGRFCGSPCAEDLDCPMDFHCDHARSIGQCVATDGLCACRDGAIGMETTCVTNTDDGPCNGVRVCTDSGLSPCEVGDCGQAPDPPVPPGPTQTEACYPGPNNTWDVCLPVISLAKIDDPAYDYPNGDASGVPTWLLGNYASPTHALDLSAVNPDTKLALNFKVKELMQTEKGPYGVFQPHAVAAIQGVREMLGSPLFVSSGYRSPGYNAGIDGAALFSRHQFGDGVDVYSETHSLESVIEACCAHGAWFVKLYTSHVHCDWRAEPLDEGFWSDLPAAPNKPTGSPSCADFGHPQTID